MTIPHPSNTERRRGIALMDCLVYIGLLALLLGLAFSCFYETTQHTRRLSRNTLDIARALQSGERWRDDVRRASEIPRLDPGDGEGTFVLPQAGGIVRYVLRGGTVLRQQLPNTNWIEALPNVKRSLIYRDQRSQLATWRWEVELESQRGKRQLVPMFTFQAVAGTKEKP